MTTPLRTTSLFLLTAFVGNVAAVDCDTGFVGPISVPYVHTDDDIEVAAYIRTLIQASNPAKYACNSLGANAYMPAGCTFVIKYEDLWQAMGEVVGGFCFSYWLDIYNKAAPSTKANRKSPILLDLDRNNFQLSAGPVSFDLDADGEGETIAWTSAGQLDGFLYLDRNGNNLVDDGSELFGDSTPLMDGELAENGYVALAEFDRPEFGGNANAAIDAADAVFSSLRIWIDIDADAIFELHESISLIEAGILEIELNYWDSPRTDEFGNEFRYIARGWIEGPGTAKRVWTTDVYFNSYED